MKIVVRSSGGSRVSGSMAAVMSRRDGLLTVVCKACRVYEGPTKAYFQREKNDSERGVKASDEIGPSLALK